MGAETGRSAPAPAPARASYQRSHALDGPSGPGGKSLPHGDGRSRPQTTDAPPAGAAGPGGTSTAVRGSRPARTAEPHGHLAVAARESPVRGGRLPPTPAGPLLRLDTATVTPSSACPPHQPGPDTPCRTGFGPSGGSNAGGRRRGQPAGQGLLGLDKGEADAGRARQETSPRKVTWPRLSHVGFGVPA